MHVSVVIPIHNEASTVPTAVPELLEQLSAVDATFEVTLVENGSTDNTAAIATDIARARPSVRVVSLDDPDYGAAMRRGFLDAGGDWVVNFDIDYFSGSFVAAAIGSEADVVLASKRAPGARDTRGPLRRLATWAFNFLLRMLFGVGVTDTHGMKAVRRRVVADIGPQVVSTQDMFDTELVIRAERAGYRIEEVPATVVETRDARSAIWGRVPRTLLALVRLRITMWREGR
jgi:glycosyltransferase involved in cell wall biosynthesis